MYEYIPVIGIHDSLSWKLGMLKTLCLVVSSNKLFFIELHVLPDIEHTFFLCGPVTKAGSFKRYFKMIIRQNTKA